LSFWEYTDKLHTIDPQVRLCQLGHSKIEGVFESFRKILFVSASSVATQSKRFGNATSIGNTKYILSI